MKSNRVSSKLFVVALGWCALVILPSGNAQTFYSNVPDFYQHQKKGPAKNQIEDPTWETFEKSNVGWCLQASTVNQFFFFKKKGYHTLFDDTAAPPPKWLPAINDAIEILFDYMVTPPGPTCAADPLLKDRINCYLNDMQVGPKQGVQGLVHQLLEQDGADVKYKSSDGTEHTIPNTKLFDVMQTYLKDGDSVNLRIKCPTCDVWWSNFHSVTVAGSDELLGKVWFADPDSNPDHDQLKPLPGNKNSNAGYTPLDAMVNCGIDNKMHTNQDCIRLRRFVGNEAIPVPVHNPPTQEEIDQRYFVTRLMPDRMTFRAKANGDYSRFDGAKIDGLNLIESIKGAAKKPGKLSPDDPNVFQVSPNGGTEIDEFFVFPFSFETEITGVAGFSLQGWTWEPVPPGGSDPWGNKPLYGGIHVYALSKEDALKGTTVLELTYNTLYGYPLPAWDVILGYNQDPANLRVQVFGVDPLQDIFQIPRSD
jgi:hypothetical protein